MSNGTKKTFQDIIFDTCILNYNGNPQIFPQLNTYYLDLLKRQFILAISEITIFELLQDATIKKEREAINILSFFKTYQINSKLLIAAAQLSTLYKEERIPNQQISTSDKIIGATAILTGSLILTADVNDFPRPFFQEAEEKLLVYKDKNRTKMLALQLLGPNQTVITERFSQRP